AARPGRDRTNRQLVELPARPGAVPRTEPACRTALRLLRPGGDPLRRRDLGGMAQGGCRPAVVWAARGSRAAVPAGPRLVRVADHGSSSVDVHRVGREATRPGPVQDGAPRDAHIVGAGRRARYGDRTDPLG